MKHLLILILFCLSLKSQFYSQAGQDKYLIENIYKNKEKGFFIDIGAHDGITYSNTYYLEKELGWSGICIEPNPKIYKQLLFFYIME